MERLVPALKVLATGALVGVLTGGVLGRVAMLVLARLNPRAAGVRSDDGFIMGQFTLAGSLNLLAAGAALGTVGAVLYLVLRRLMIGPRWFQVLSMSVGPGVVVGAGLVHTDGVDFRLLDPVWLAVGMFVLIPTLYAAALTLLAERWAPRPEPRWRLAPLEWAARAGLAVLFVIAVADLASDVNTLA